MHPCSALIFATLASIIDFALGTKSLTCDESAVVVTTADGGNVVVVSLFFCWFLFKPVLPKNLGDGVVGSVSTSLFFSGFCSKGWATLFS